MTTATIMGKPWKTADSAYLAVSVRESDGINHEYIGRVALADLAGKTGAEQKALLVAAAKAERDRQQGTRVEIAGITGTITI